MKSTLQLMLRLGLGFFFLHGSLSQTGWWAAASLFLGVLFICLALDEWPPS